MKPNRNTRFLLLVFSFLGLVLIPIHTEGLVSTNPQNATSLLKIPRTLSLTNQAEIQSVIVEGSTISITLGSDLTTLTSTGLNFYILILFEGNEDSLNWEFAMIFSYSSSNTASAYWMIGDPYVFGNNWIEGSKDTHYQYDLSLVRLTFLEYAALGYSNTQITPLALLSSTQVAVGSNDFSTVLFEFLALIPVSSASPPPPPPPPTSTPPPPTTTPPSSEPTTNTTPPSEPTTNTTPSSEPTTNTTPPSEPTTTTSVSATLPFSSFSDVSIVLFSILTFALWVLIRDKRKR